MALDPLVTLRSAIAAKVEPQLLGEDSSVTDDITKAQTLKFPPVPGVSDTETSFPLSTETRFQSRDPETKMIDLKTAYNCWITRELNVTDYITVSDERNIFNLKFLERTDFITWLEGASLESEYIKEESETKKDSAADKSKGSSGDGPHGIPFKPTKHEVPPNLKRIYEQERTLIDHNKNLRGLKTINFSSVSTECHQKIMNVYKQGGSKIPPSITSQSKTSRKEPIIILSPSASSLLNMANVKEFLENGVFVPTPLSSNAPELQRISRNSAVLGPMKFLVVKSVDKFKPEYWDRVIAVFVTGQAWQFKSYQWSDPNVLFQKVLGFALTYKGDPIPPNVKQWNVKIEVLDRNLRFKDKGAVENIWERIEQGLISRGWTKKK